MIRTNHADRTSYYVVAVAVVIRRQGAVLAMRRAQSKDASPGLWETLSGRVDAGEEPLTAAAREVLEECGLEVALHPRPLTAYTATRLAAPMIVIVYAADHLGGEVTLSAEHDAYAWLTPEAFAERTTLDKLADAVHLAFRIQKQHP